MKYIILFFIILSFNLTKSFASLGNSSGGGGDNLEMQVNEIRADLLNWIKNDGASELKFSSNLSLYEYIQEMTQILQPQFVIISFDNSVITVNGEEKTCQGFVNKIDSKPHIRCNINRYNKNTLSEKYSLIHHEFAGLVGIEKNIGAASDYEISSQITNYLNEEKALKLEITPQYIDRTKFIRLQRIDTFITTEKEKLNSSFTINGIKNTYSIHTYYSIKVIFINEENKKQIIKNDVKTYDQPNDHDYKLAVEETIRQIAFDNLSCENIFKIAQRINCLKKVNFDPANVLDEALENGFKRSWLDEK